MSDLENLWKNQSTAIGIEKIDIAKTTKELQQRHQKLQKTLFWRDFREVGVCILLIPIWITLGLSKNALWSWYLMIPILVFVGGFMLHGRSKNKTNQTTWGDSLVEGLEKAIRDLDYQIWLLKNVAIWYLGPLGLGLVINDVHLYFLGQQSLNSTLGSTLFVFFLYLAIWWANQLAAKNSLEPHRDSLRNTLNELR
ncbi:MAG: hypothetical protein ACPGN3_17080 [Opitutales bacterium]